jgi:hypothetical protein
MNGFAWPLLELTTSLLDQQEREVVLGDLLETNENACRGFLDVFGLILRRQAAHWKHPRPWFAGLAVTLPSSYLLMAVSFSVSCTYQRLVNHRIYAGHWPTGHEGFPLLLAWSWSAGYIVGSLSPRTVWANAALSVMPAYLSLCMSDSTLCVFLFLLPAILGVRRGLRSTPISLRSASFLAFAVTVLMISAWSNKALWIFNWLLIGPAWYVVAAAWRSGRTGSERMALQPSQER